MKRKRDIQGKFALKDDDYRQVRSLRLTDDTDIMYQTDKKRRSAYNLSDISTCNQC